MFRLMTLNWSVINMFQKKEAWLTNEAPECWRGAALFGSQNIIQRHELPCVGGSNGWTLCRSWKLRSRGRVLVHSSGRNKSQFMHLFLVLGWVFRTLHPSQDSRHHQGEHPQVGSYQVKFLASLMTGQPTSPQWSVNLPPPNVLRNNALWSGLVNYWFPLMRPFSTLVCEGGYVRGHCIRNPNNALLYKLNPSKLPYISFTSLFDPPQNGSHLMTPNTSVK